MGPVWTCTFASESCENICKMCRFCTNRAKIWTIWKKVLVDLSLQIPGIVCRKEEQFITFRLCVPTKLLDMYVCMYKTKLGGLKCLSVHVYVLGPKNYLILQGIPHPKVSFVLWSHIVRKPRSPIHSRIMYLEVFDVWIVTPCLSCVALDSCTIFYESQSYIPSIFICVYQDLLDLIVTYQYNFSSEVQIPSRVGVFCVIFSMVKRLVKSTLNIW